MMIKDSKEAKENETLAAFMKVLEPGNDHEIVDFRTLQDRPFMKFWPNFCIAEFVEEVQEWKVTYWGTEILKSYGTEMTDKYLDEEEIGSQKDEILEDFFNAVREDKTSFASGTIDWKNKNYTTWYRVVMPLIKNDKKCALCVAAFS